MAANKKSKAGWVIAAAVGVPAVVVGGGLALLAPRFLGTAQSPAMAVGTKPGDVVVVRQFFQDTDEGRNLDAAIKSTASALEDSAKLTADVSLKETAQKYANAFDGYTKDLRSNLQAQFNTLIAVMPQFTSEDKKLELTKETQRLMDRTSRRTAQLRAIKDAVDAYKVKPTPEGLTEIGQLIRDLLSAANEAGETKLSANDVPVDGLARVMNNVLGNSHHKLETWSYQANGAATIDMPLAVSGDSRITNNIDKSPFMQRTRKMKITVLNAGDDGKRAFAAHLKSDVNLGGDGDRQVNDKVNVQDGQEFEADQAVEKDVAYYLAWRGGSMTKEEFAKRYPMAVFRIELQP
ncbi:MAG: hypothetical protein QOE14_448 [Humisphaera sp.]|nr:hypothetical protein [Humisphaera sp.]